MLTPYDTRLPPDLPNANQAGGEVHFTRLASGAWIVDRLRVCSDHQSAASASTIAMPRPDRAEAGALTVRSFFQAMDFSRRSSLNILEPADAQIVENYDVVIHLAGHLDKSPEGAEECFQTNADGTRNIIRNMREGSVFIYASTKDVYGDQASAY